MKSGIIETGTRTQLFVDGRFLHTSTGVDIVTHRVANALEPCLVPDRSWESGISGYNTVLFADGKYHLWYTVRGNAGDRNCIGYAVSPDGVVWEKPDLGMAMEIEGGNNNIVLGFGAGGVSAGLRDISCHVFEDPNHAKRFAMLARVNPTQGLSLLRSDDGIRWEPTGKVVLDDERKYDAEGIFVGEDFHLDSQNVVFWDADLKSYVAYVRRNFHRQGQYRTVARGTSADLSHFAHPRDMEVMLTPDPADPSEGDASRLDFYTNATVKYPWADDVYFMFPSVYYKYDGWFAADWGEQPLNSGVMDVGFAASRNGIDWIRYDRGAFLGLGYRGAFDAASIYMACGIVPSGTAPRRELAMYYCGTDHNHGWGRQDKHGERNNRILKNAGVDPAADASGIGRVTIRRDGFTSAHGDYRGGMFVTPGLIFDGDRLSLNVDTSAVGEVSVEILDIEGSPIAGFKHADCRRIHSVNDVSVHVSWSGGELRALAGKPVRLHFRIRSADLYSFQFGDATGEGRTHV